MFSEQTNHKTEKASGASASKRKKTAVAATEASTVATRKPRAKVSVKKETAQKEPDPDGKAKTVRKSGSRKPGDTAVQVSVSGKRKTKRTIQSDLTLVECIAEAMLTKKGINVVSLDLRDISGASFDFFVVCEATSGPQVRAIADEIAEQVYKNFKEDPLHTEGYMNAEWVLLDFGGIVAHIFLDTVRQHYRLEELWGDSKMNFFKGEE